MAFEITEGAQNNNVANSKASFYAYDYLNGTVKSTARDSTTEQTLGRLELQNASDSSQRIQWSHSLYSSFQTAIKEGKPLVVEFSQDTCAWCNKLNEDTMNSPLIEQYKNKAVFARLDPDVDDDQMGNVYKLAKGLDITRYPTTVVLDVSDNSIKERGRIVGYLEPTAFNDKLGHMISPDTATA